MVLTESDSAAAVETTVVNDPERGVKMVLVGGNGAAAVMAH